MNKVGITTWRALKISPEWKHDDSRLGVCWEGTEKAVGRRGISQERQTSHSRQHQSIERTVVLIHALTPNLPWPMSWWQQHWE